MPGRLLINADDFGWDADTVAATIECFEKGAITSATIMPRMSATDRAVQFALEHPQFAFGAHLTWGGDGLEQPLASPETIPALVGPDGMFLQSNVIRMKAVKGQLPIDQIEHETEAQLSSLVQRGVKLSHIDSHGHLHKFKPFVIALSRVLPRFGISKVRNVQDLYLKRPLKSPTFWLGGFWRRRIMKHFRTTPHFYMCTGPGDVNWVQSLLARNIAGDTEIGVHPASANHPDSWRNAERLEVLAIPAKAQAAGFTLGSWRDL